MHYYLRRLKIDCMIFLRKIKHHLKKYTKVINNHDFVKPLLVFQRENEAVLLLEKKSLKDEAGITVSKDGFNFSPVEETMSLPKNIPHFPKSVILPNFYYHGQKVMFFGDRSLKIAYLTKDNKWKAKANPLLTLPHPIELGNVFIRKEGKIRLLIMPHILLFLRRRIQVNFFLKQRSRFWNIRHCGLVKKRNLSVLFF